jgi:t-SNARE complex subunit (syntaxin)
MWTRQCAAVPRSPSSTPADAAADGVRKIDQARKAYRYAADEAFDLQIAVLSASATAAEMEAALGPEGALIHAAALAGQAGEGVVKRAKILHRYRKVPVGDGSVRAAE